MDDFFFRGAVSDLDPALGELLDIEAERQYRKIILIPSESSAPKAVRDILASSFQNIYAEGYPDQDTRAMGEDEIFDYAARLANYRRYSDPRYYKGVEYADVVEALARRRCAEAFAANGRNADDLYVNVQPLSGAPANNAVYHALVQPGETVMGMNLLHGGHLSHGSPVNRSGKFYDIASYGVDPQTEQIDYDAVAALARQVQPKMIIGGFSSYPWAADWEKFRAIADEVGAYLLADIAHVAGLVAAGEYPSPIGIADVVTFTTHKSLCGPRGAVIITTQKSLARKLDRAVFPGEQGGPHINTIAAQALTFKLAMTDQFKALQKQIRANCLALNNALQDSGFRIPFGGTNTHLTNIAVTSVQGADGTGLSGDQAARILDLAGIVTNRNTIPGDRSAAAPSGLRLGTPWITQRGFRESETRELAAIMADLLLAVKPYGIAGRKNTLRRAKVDFAVLNEARMRVRDLAQSVGIDYEPSTHGYPHFYNLDAPAPNGPYVEISLHGERSEDFLLWTTGCRPCLLSPGDVTHTQVQTPDKAISLALRCEEGRKRWTLTVPAEDSSLLLMWLRDLSDGFVTVDPEDLRKKIPGPVVVLEGASVDALPEESMPSAGADKPWMIGVGQTDHGAALPVFVWQEPEEALQRTALFETHKALGAKMAPFAGWEMPVWYSSVMEEHLATREAAGLFDVSHMGVYQVEGHQACAFLDSVVTNDVGGLAIGESLYTQFLDPDGQVIDDTMVYRRRDQMFLVVVNAANDAKDWAWLNAVRDGSVLVDRSRPWSTANGRGCTLRNLRDSSAGADMRVDIALQGPKSREILLALGCAPEAAETLKAMKWAGVMEGVFGGFDLVVSRTGYTGERVAFELFVHPDQSVALWDALLEVGGPLGLKPVGLGARDSLRTEAGLPLYGHEMAGEMSLGVGDSGFGAYVKTYKPWFIGRDAFITQEAERDCEITRFRFNDKGVRMAHTGDPVVDKRGRVVGHVTSCAVDREGYLLGQVYLKRSLLKPGTPIAVFQGASSRPGKAPGELGLGDRATVPTAATVLSRFPKR